MYVPLVLNYAMICRLASTSIPDKYSVPHKLPSSLGIPYNIIYSSNDFLIFSNDSEIVVTPRSFIPYSPLLSLLSYSSIISTIEENLTINKSLYIIGHGLSGSTAILLALILESSYDLISSAVFTFGAPFIYSSYCLPPSVSSLYISNYIFNFLHPLDPFSLFSPPFAYRVNISTMALFPLLSFKLSSLLISLKLLFKSFNPFSINRYIHLLKLYQLAHY